MAKSERIVYWDACTFLALINSEAGRYADCASIWSEGEAGKLIIVTSYLTLAEVFRARCEKHDAKPLTSEQSDKIDFVFASPFVEPILLDGGIANTARALCRRFPECKKPNDGIHLATAMRTEGVSELHTFDDSDLLHLDGKVLKPSGVPLRICTPYCIERRLSIPIPKDDSPSHPAYDRPAN